MSAKPRLLNNVRCSVSNKPEYRGQVQILLISSCALIAPLSVRLCMKIHHESSCWKTPKTKNKPNKIRNFFSFFKWKLYMKWISIFTKQFKWVPPKQEAGIALYNWCPWVDLEPEPWVGSAGNCSAVLSMTLLWQQDKWFRGVLHLDPVLLA